MESGSKPRALSPRLLSSLLYTSSFFASTLFSELHCTYDRALGEGETGTKTGSEVIAIVRTSACEAGSEAQRVRRFLFPV